MTLESTLLRKLAEWRPQGSDRQALVLPDLGAGWSVRLLADKQDQVGCTVWEIEAYRPRPERALPLSERCLALVKQWRGGRDALTVLEVDTARNQAQLRSTEPIERQGNLTYLELLVDGDARLSLKRYRAATTEARREQVAFPVTHETLSELIPGLIVD